jgi:hypothetical protein
MTFGTLKISALLYSHTCEVMSVVLFDDHFIRCAYVVRDVEIFHQSIILRVYYRGRVWIVYCYRSIPHLTAQCLLGNIEDRIRVEEKMKICLSALKWGLCLDAKLLQRRMVNVCRIYFTVEQLSTVKASRWQTRHFWSTYTRNNVATC